MRLFLLIGIVTLHVASLNASVDAFRFFYPTSSLIPVKNYDATPFERERALHEVTKGTSVFSSQFVKEIGNSISGNLVFSPISVSMALSMTAYGAGGSTAEQMHRVLQHPVEKSVAKVGFQSLVDSFDNYKGVTLRLANKIYLPFGISPKPEFMEMISQAFRSEAESLDFHNSEGASRIINKWCEDKTDNRIKNIVSPADLNDQTAMVLVNAVYFKGTWKIKFDEKNTQERPFYVDGITEKSVPTMHVNASYNFGRLPEYDAEFVELPYEDNDVSMFIILPKKKDGLAQLERNLEYITIDELMLRSSPRKVRLSLPKFKIESEIQLQKPLERMGLTEMFTTKSDFSEIIDFPSLMVSKIVQKAFIEVNELGTEAAAATFIGTEFKMFTGPVKFVANHPFFAIIATTGRNRGNLFTVRYTGH